MFSKFFIERPGFATVVALIMVLIGSIGLRLLPIEQYPEIAPPTVQISANYPGADPQTIVDAVTAPIEQEVIGVEGMIYMKSTTAANGQVNIDVTFELGTDPDLATVYTQNRVAVAEPRLPQDVRNRGVQVKKRSPSLLMVVSLYSEKDPQTGEPYYDGLYLSNYSTVYLRDKLSTVKGVGEVFTFGSQDYSMRIWLDPSKLAARDLTSHDVVNALREQNVQVPAGQIGQPPAATDSGFQLTIQTEGRLTAEAGAPSVTTSNLCPSLVSNPRS